MRLSLTRMAKQAALMGTMLPNYPDPNNKNVTFPPSPYYRFLHLISMGTNLAVELGVCGGGGSFHMAMSSKVAVGIDVANDYEDNINYIQDKCPNFHFLLGDSIELASVVFNRFGLIDVLFIDTTHTYEQTMAEYKTYQPYLSSKAVVCLDDLFRPGMDKAWAEMPETKVRFDFLHPSQSPTDGGFGS